MKGIIIYKTKYGATEKYADLISDKTNLKAVSADDISIHKLDKYDYIIIGSPLYCFGLLLKGWIKKNEKELLRKKIFLFSVGGTPAEEKEALEKTIKRSISREMYKHIKYYHFRGVFKFEKLSFIDKLLMRIIMLLEKREIAKRKMREGFELIDKAYIGSLINDLKKLKEKEK